MKTLAFALTLALLAARGTPNDQAGTPASGPRIRVEPASFDFGKATQNKTLKKQFSIRNFGNQDLVIEQVTTTCGCTAALMDDKVVKPGGTAPLAVSLETRAYKGRVQRSVMIRSNDTGAALVEVKVEATVEAARP